jgi:hypothetical protein
VGFFGAASALRCLAWKQPFLETTILFVFICARDYDDLNFQLSLIALALQTHLGVARSA